MLDGVGLANEHANGSTSETLMPRVTVAVVLVVVVVLTTVG